LLGVLPIGRSVWTYAVWDDGCILTEQPLPPLDGHPPPDYVSPSEPQQTWEEEYLEQLAAALLNPLEARLAELGPDDRLIISTSDPLAFVPFSALPYRGRPLCEHVCISQTHGIGILESCLDRAENSFNSVLCVGNPSRPDRPEISETHLEAVTIAGLFRESGKQAVSLVWDLATVPNLKAEAGRYDVLHLACHAEVAAVPGESSLLLLTPDLNMQDSGDLSEDRILSELPLREGCLVNLAGCQTGVLSNSKVFLLGGLVPSFLIAGAGSVIGSLWDLDDSGAATFQIEFYRLLVTGKSPAESLAETQRACLMGELGPEMRDVGMWAGYALYGVG
jgi:CHAT domain-containing protein